MSDAERSIFSRLESIRNCYTLGGCVCVVVCVCVCVLPILSKKVETQLYLKS